MLKQLYIKNFTLIDSLNISFHSGFSVITGETGAGKSIILGAIDLLLGQRADIKAIKSGSDRCIIEAHFDLRNYDFEKFFKDKDIDFDAQDCIIRRELSISGKSRAFINDTPVPLTTMRELGEKLVDIHSQHQNLLLNEEDFQLNVIDIVANDSKQLKDYSSTFNVYKEMNRKLEALRTNIAKTREREEFIRFQHKELTEANLQENEQEELERECETMNHCEEIKSALFVSDDTLNGEGGIVEKIKSITTSLNNIEKVYPKVSDIAKRLDDSFIELKDIAQEISSDLESIEFNPADLDNANARLDTIYSLQHKFHVNSIRELLTIQQDLGEQINNIDHGDEELQRLEDEVKQQSLECQKKAEELTKIRMKAAQKVEKEMKERLYPLGIPNVQFKIEIDNKTICADGCDKVSFLFSANKNMPMQPVSHVASGGEIARVMLSIKAMISNVIKLPTIIFDEIDTGVSGKIAEKMAHIMKEMGDNNRQIISITHLPQIAALGTYHYKVAKRDTENGTITEMHQLSKEERINEIAQMLSGSDITSAAINNAKELLNY
jgi:DNA repair protein RecN (Recombination protein N)